MVRGTRMPNSPIPLGKIELIMAEFLPVDLIVFGERVRKERVSNVSAAGWGNDGKFLEVNIVIEFFRGQVRLFICPIPVWGTKGHGSETPSFDFRSVFFCEFQRSLLESLL